MFDYRQTPAGQMAVRIAEMAPNLARSLGKIKSPDDVTIGLVAALCYAIGGRPIIMMVKRTQPNWMEEYLDWQSSGKIPDEKEKANGL